MFWRPWFFWKFILRRMAKAQGFQDPVAVFSDLRRFARPAEVWVPTELLRSGALMQVRGLINTQVIQHNTDWVWPYWAEQQFDPASPSFIPHALSPTHINLTHRNWTALGLPGMAEYPIVDPRGLVTPFYDGWSIDAWLWKSAAQNLLPSRCLDVRQTLSASGEELSVQTVLKNGEFVLEWNSSVCAGSDHPVCRLALRAWAPTRSKLAVALRPYNPEGVSFINRLQAAADGWLVDGKHAVRLDRRPERVLFSDYKRGDVFGRLEEDGILSEEKDVDCPAGMASSAALYPVNAGNPFELHVEIPLKAPAVSISPWSAAVSGACRLDVPDALYRRLFETAVRSLVLLSPDDVFPGPYMYKRFWFRDAAFILNAMAAANLAARAEAALDRFPGRQTPAGYFLSQNGEWDSNGQALWILERFAAMAGGAPKRAWREPVLRAGEWIIRKRTKKDGSPHAGLLPAGFSAEHFGPSDNYYWDDLWAAAGLRSASAMARAWGDDARARRFDADARDLLDCVDRAIAGARKNSGPRAVPAAPYRRLDGGSIGALAATYPLQLWEPGDPRLTATIDFLMNTCIIRGAFYQKIGHAGVNAYLSLHVAQALLRAGDGRFEPIVRAVADLASPTGQWPEAVHPRTGGGCMGDGQHMWAAAEWILMMKNFFVREEEKDRTLVVGSGIPRAWLDSEAPLSIGPVRTRFGEMSLTVRGGRTARVAWEAAWSAAPARIDVRLAGYEAASVLPAQSSVEIQRSGA